MTIEIKVPVLPESVADALIATWHKKEGEIFEQDENLVDIETDKVVLEVVAPERGVIEKIIRQQGDTVLAEEVIGIFKAVSGNAAASPAKAAAEPVKAAPAKAAPEKSAPEKSAPEKAVPAVLAETSTAGPAARRQMAQGGVASHTTSTSSALPALSGERIEKRVPMTRLRLRIAERLLSAQHQAAILTTFNEVNMQPVMDLRNRYKDQFEKTHGVKLGFMSFFTKAATEALKRFPVVNASLDGKDVVYHGYFDIGVAVSTPRGLVVPVLRGADKMNMAQIEKGINDLGVKARDGNLSMEEMTGGTFTISNGGVFGSLLSTPILNPPQTGILGMHKIEPRPVVENNQIVIRPMMYLAFSYDHRLIDGSESVRFLVTIKELIEDPARLLLDL